MALVEHLLGNLLELRPPSTSSRSPARGVAGERAAAPGLNMGCISVALTLGEAPDGGNLLMRKPSCTNAKAALTGVRGDGNLVPCKIPWCDEKDHMAFANALSSSLTSRHGAT